jgi:hypothetical protein
MKGAATAMMLSLAGLTSGAVAAEPCAGAETAEFSQLGDRLADVKAIARGDLLAVRLLIDPSQNCRLAFEVEVLTREGRIEVLGFDAINLDAVDLAASADWRPYGEPGEGGDREDEDQELGDGWETGGQVEEEQRGGSQDDRERRDDKDRRDDRDDRDRDEDDNDDDGHDYGDGDDDD